MTSKKPVSPQDLHWLIQDKYKGDILAPGLAADKKRLEDGEPLAYVIGWVPFLNCQIDLSLRTLIPRPETEFWVGEVIKELKTGAIKSVDVAGSLGEEPIHILDLCCGSGCIGIALLKNLPNVTVDFVDISEVAIQQTKINLQKNDDEKKSLSKRARTMVSDLFTQLPAQPQAENSAYNDSQNQYDLIVCNPPYVDLFGDFAPEVAYEPAQALFAQNHGLALIEQIINHSKKYLKLGGKLILEFGKGQEDEIAKLSQRAGWEHADFYDDQFGVKRWAALF